MSTSLSLPKTVSSQAVTHFDKLSAQQVKHSPVENQVSKPQPHKVPQLFIRKNFWLGIGFSTVASAIGYTVLRAEHATSQLHNQLHALQSNYKYKNKQNRIVIDSAVKWLLLGCTVSQFVTSGVFAYLKGKGEGEDYGMADWDKDNRSFIRGWKHGFTHAEAGAEKYRDSRDKLGSISVNRFLLADKTRDAVMHPRFGNVEPKLQSTVSLWERLKKLYVNTDWLEVIGLSTVALCGYGAIKKQQQNELKKEIQTVQNKLQSLSKKEKKAFSRSGFALVIAAASIPVTHLLQPLWFRLGYKQGHKQGLQRADAEELNFKTGFMFGITDPAAKSAAALVTVTNQEKSWADKTIELLHKK